MGPDELIGEKLGRQIRDVRAACIAFPREVLETDYPLELLLKTWQSMPRSTSYMREDMKDALSLLKILKGWPVDRKRELVFDLVTCPIDIRNEELVNYWRAAAVNAGADPDNPTSAYYEPQALLEYGSHNWLRT